MIPNVTRGEDAPGLVRYLFGPGDENEHTNQRRIAASADIVAEGGPHFTGEGQLRALAREFDAPRDLFGTEVAGGHVWHCSLSLPPRDGQLSDEQWADVARRVVERMGFSDTEGKAPCRWLAVHHGLSADGNDHIHLMVNLVRTDGTKADVWRDYTRVQQICGQIERDMGLSIVEGRSNGRAMPGTKRGEREAAARRGRPEPDRLTLARRVRAAAATAASEADFVGNLRSSGVIARPRYGSGGRREVVGYSVALHTEDGTSPVWYGGGKLARDLTLSRLREQWPDSDPAAAVEAWSQRSARGRSQAHAWLRDETAWEMAAQQIQQVRESLASVPPGDVVRWAQAAQGAAGVLAVLSARMEPNRPGPLARAADVLARSAQHTTTHRGTAPAARPGQLRGAAMAAKWARTGAWSAVGEARVILALRNTMRAIHDMHQARDERDQARRLAETARGELFGLQQAREAMQASPGALPPAPGVDRGPGWAPEARRDDPGFGW
ncbi:relaxase/mobilization nuclease domain-containing protein [Streptomyces alboflavus]|uniref:relaxase/mobilization nuclease domain-containing protein n=1 Tax=Streptomyces alboflavus TaxID=67267 RepID=UPI000F657CB4|nr:relaxase/mobilization nuclease domain-containing protein [Streptomyces alboflavus]